LRLLSGDFRKSQHRFAHGPCRHISRRRLAARG
jgi:hypothetical protein